MGGLPRSLLLWGVWMMLVLVVGQRERGGADAQRILGSNQVLIDTFPVNAGSLCYEIPEVPQDGADAMRLMILVKKLAPSGGTVDLTLVVRDTYLPTLKKFDYQSSTSNPWLVWVEEAIRDSTAYFACLIGNPDNDITFSIQTTSTYSSAVKLAPGAVTNVAIDPGRTKFFSIDANTRPTSDTYLNVSVSGFNYKAVHISMNLGAMPTGWDLWSGESPLTVPFLDEVISVADSSVFYIGLNNPGTQQFSGSVTAAFPAYNPQFINMNTGVKFNLKNEEDWVIYTTTVVAQYSLTALQIFMEVKDGDPDIYFSCSGIPSKHNYEAHDASWYDDSKMVVLVQRTGTCYLTIFADEKDSSGTLTLSTFELTPIPLTNNTPVSINASSNWQYFTISVPDFGNDDTNLTVSAITDSRTAGIYIDFFDVPTAYDYYESDFGKNPSVEVLSPSAGTWYIAFKPGGKSFTITATITSLTIPVLLNNEPSLITREKKGSLFQRDPLFLYKFESNGYDLISLVINATGYFVLKASYDVPPQWNREADFKSNGDGYLTIPSANGTWYFLIQDLSSDDTPFFVEAIGATLETPLSLDNCNSPVSGTGVANGWNYYAISIDNLQFIQITVTTNDPSMVNIYYAADRLPSELISEGSVSGNGSRVVTLTMAPYKTGTHYIGVKSLQSGSYTLTSCLSSDPPVSPLNRGVTVRGTFDKQNDIYYIDVVDPSIDVLIFDFKCSSRWGSQIGEVCVQWNSLPDITNETTWCSSLPVSYYPAPRTGRYFIVAYADDFPTSLAPDYTLRCTPSNKDSVATPLVSGEPITFELSSGWRFFSAYVGNASAPFWITLTELDTNSFFANLYAAYGQLPTEDQYKYRGAVSESHSSISATPSRGMYYFGVRNTYQSSKYAILSSFDGSRDTVRLVAGIKQSFSVLSNTWKDFSFQVNYGSMFIIEFPKLASDSVGVYVQAGKLPSPSSYLRRSAAGASAIYIAEPTYGTYYISILNTNASLSRFNFDLTVFAGGSCENKKGCKCPPGSGDDCAQTISGVDMGAVYSGFVDEGSWVHYQLNLDHGTALFINFLTSFASRDEVFCFVSYNQPPTLASFDFATGIGPKQRSLSILDPNLGVLYVSVYGKDVVQYAKYSISVDISDDEECPNHCSGHGTCNGDTDVCKCDPSWGEDDCSAYEPQINADDSTVLRGHLVQGHSNHFLVVGTPEAAAFNLLVEATLVGGIQDGSVIVYANLGTTQPSSNQYDLVSTTTNSSSSLSSSISNDEGEPFRAQQSQTLVVKQSMKQGRVVSISVYCPEASSSSVEYRLAIVPIKPKGGSWIGLDILFVLLVIVFLVALGFAVRFFVTKTEAGRKLWSIVSRGQPKRRKTREFSLQDDDSLEEEEDLGGDTSQDAFSSALSRAAAEEEEGQEYPSSSTSSASNSLLISLDD